MKYLKILIIGLAIICGMLIAASCSSSSKNLQTPVSPDPQIPSLSDVQSSEGIGNHNVVAVYDAVIDPESQTFTITPSRNVEFHFPLTSLYPNVVKITGYGFTPHFWADIQLSHPLPYSGIDGFDARVIAVLPANPGVSMEYPNLNIHGNNSVVMYPDGYTTLFDRLDFAGNVNPFMAYFAWTPNRVWSSSGFSTETIKWDLNLGGFGGPIRFKLIVDVSTNYPNPPQPVIDNAQEPVSMNAIVGPGMTSDGGSAPVEVTLLDWQGTGGIGGVVIEAPQLFSGIRWLSYIGPGPNPNEYIYNGTMENEYLAPAGEYRFIASTWDVNNHVYLMKEFLASVSSGGLNPVEVTPPWLNIQPIRIAYQAPYAYVASASAGLHIFNMADPANPFWVSWIDTGGYAVDVAIDGDYAYVAATDEGLSIVNISNPSAPYVVNTISSADSFNGVKVADGYAYCAAGYYFYIFDVSPPESAYAVNALPVGYNSQHIAISRGYAYLACEELFDYGRLKIYDIDPVNSAYEVNNISLSYPPNDIDISGGYLYVASSSSLAVVDISPPQSAYVLTYAPVYGTRSIQCVGSYAYASLGYSVGVIDISVPGSETLINEFGTGEIVIDVFVSGSLGISGKTKGMVTFGAENPGNEYFIQILPHVGGTWKVDTAGEYLFLTGNDYGVNVFSLGDPQNPESVKTIAPDGWSGATHYSNGYLYYAENNREFYIIDMDPLESAYVVTNLSLPDDGRAIDVVNGYAYVAVDNAGLSILDVDPPESAYLVKTVDTPGAAYDVEFYNGYVYLADVNSGLQIIDVEPPASAYIVKTIDTPGGAEEVVIRNGYAYIADWSNGLVVVDIEPFGSESIVKTVPTPDNAWGIDVTDDYAFLACDEAGFVIIDINPLDSASVQFVFPIDYMAFDIALNGNFAYVTDWAKGLRIFRLQ